MIDFDKYNLRTEDNDEHENAQKSGDPYDIPTEFFNPDNGAEHNMDNAPKVGDLLVDGRYIIIEVLGRGAMGIVYLCLEKEKRTQVVLKALLPEISKDHFRNDEILRNFNNVRGLIHQNIAAVMDFITDRNGDSFLVMEYVNGEELDRWCRKIRDRKSGRVSLGDALPRLREIADALDFAHSRNVMHRDLKPSNVMVNFLDGKVKVIDFGIAEKIDDRTRATREYHGRSGTRAYMSPEQWRGDSQGAASDQYALAVIAYEMLSGHLPFDATDSDALKNAVLNDAPAPIKGIPSSVNAAILRALSKKATDRFPTCRDFIDSLTGDGVAQQTEPPRDSGFAAQEKPLDELKQEVYLMRLSIREKKQSIDSEKHDRGQSFGSHLDSLERNYKAAEAVMEDSASGDARFRLARQWYLAALKEFEWITSNAPLRNQAATLLEEVEELRKKALELEVDKQAFPVFNSAAEVLDSARKSYENGDFQNALTMLGKVKDALSQANDDALQERKRVKKSAKKKIALRILWTLGAIALIVSLIWGISLVDLKDYSISEKDGNKILHFSDVELKLIKVKKGDFQMGSPGSELGRYGVETLHGVTLTEDFWLGEMEVTQGQWKAVMGSNSSFFKKGDDYPVEEVSWKDAMKFCKKLNRKYKKKLPYGYEFSLPTEAQWEYACRAGTTTALNSGKDITPKDGSCPNLDAVAWYDENSGDSTHPVGQKQPNAWGFYDMHGNVWEWCLDKCDFSIVDFTVITDTYRDGVTDPCCTQGSDRVGRGGSWDGCARDCRSAGRSCFSPAFRISYLGFRLALVPVQ